MSDEKPDHERLVYGDDFSLIRAEITYQGLLAILVGFHATEKHRLAQPPLWDWALSEVKAEFEGVKELEIRGIWSEEFPEYPFPEHLIGTLRFVPINNRFANIYAEREGQTADGATLFDSIWEHLRNSLEGRAITKAPTAKGGRGPNLDTVEKLRRLAEIREGGLNKTISSPTWTAACQLAGVDPKTVLKHLAELRLRWDDKDYRLADIEKALESLEK